MYIKNKFIAFFIFISIFTLSIFNIKNPEKTKLYLFTSKIEDISLGNLMTISFLSGFTFGSIFSLISKNKSNTSVRDDFSSNEEIDKFDDNNSYQESEYDRPPERDVRESQPTISVNYRFVEKDNNSYNLKNNKNNLNDENNDWLNKDDEW